MTQPSIEMRRSLHRFGIWCGVLYLLLLILGWGLVAGFIPPIRPSASANQVAHLFRHDTTRIRAGMVLVMFSALAFIPFGAVFVRYMTRIEGGAGVLTYSALLGCVGNMILSFYPGLTWLLAAYRPERSAQLTYLINDAAWLEYVGAVSMIMALPLSVTLAAFLDDRPDPVFPRWAGYLNLWICVVIVPDQALFFFHTGPFAWNGLFGLWIPITAFGAWFISTMYLLYKAVEAEASPVAAMAA